MISASNLACFGMPFILCMGLTPLIRKLAFQKGWIAHPCSDRWHKKPTALFGGVAIFASIVISLITMIVYPSGTPPDVITGIGSTPQPFGITLLLAVGLLFILGLIDDFRNIAPHLKLIGQIGVASLVVCSGYRLNWFAYPVPDSLVTLLWIVGITNAMNYIDNMDGLCAGICLIVAISFAFLFLSAAPDAALIALIIAGASAGFLIYNFDPAKIFMGDCGSMVLGFAVSFLSLHYSANISGSAITAVVVPVLILAIPILDTVLVTLDRAINGRMVFVGGKDHTSHRLVLLGLSEKKAVLLLYGLSTLGAIAAIQFNRIFL